MIELPDDASTAPADVWTGAVAGTGMDTAPGLDDLEVVLVCYRSRQHVETLLRGWPEDLSVVIVDNSAEADGLDELAERHSHVRYLSGGGQGFARAANLGARSSTKPYVVFVNPDSRPTAEQLLELVRGLDGEAAAITHAATPIGPEGGIEYGVGGWEPSIGRAVMHATGLYKLLPRAGLFAHPRAGEHVDVDWVTGTCMAVRRQPFCDLGGYDEAFFVYCEDMAFGRRARQGGWRSRLRHDVLVPHGAGSSGAPSSEMRRLQGASFTTYTSRYSRPAVRGALIRMIYVLGSGGRLLIHTATASRERSAATRAIIRGVLTHKAYVGRAEVARARLRELEIAGSTARRNQLFESAGDERVKSL